MHEKLFSQKYNTKDFYRNTQGENIFSTYIQVKFTYKSMEKISVLLCG